MLRRFEALDDTLLKGTSLGRHSYRIKSLDSAESRLELVSHFSMMYASDSSSHRNSIAPDTLHSRRTSLVPDMARYNNRRLSTSSQSSTLYGSRRKSIAMPRFAHPVSEASQRIPKYSNSYKTEPDENKRFKTKPVADLIEIILKERLSDMSYSAERCRKLLVPMAEEIKGKVKLLGYDRYKLVCVVHIGSINNQDVRIASRCLWDASFDRVASSSFCNDTLFASASVFGIYQE